MSKTIAIRNANLQNTLKKKNLNPEKIKENVKGLLPYFDAGFVIQKSVAKILLNISRLNLISFTTDTILDTKYYTNVQIPNKVIDLLKDARLSNISLNSSSLNVNFGISPNEFINAVKITNGVGGEQRLNLNSVSNIYFPTEPYKSNIPNVNKIKFTSSSQVGDYIIIIWYNAPLINLSPGYRVVTNTTNIIFETV